MTYLTERQRDVFAFIAERIAREGVAPTLREISEAFGFSSTASAQKHVALLERKGLLRRVKNQKRGLELLDRLPARSRRLPLLGTVAAGAPIESYPGSETISVPDDMLRGGEHFVLRVRGESMIEDGIHDGDFVVVERLPEAPDGEVVVALVEGEVTLKRLFRVDQGRVRLQPANREMAPLDLAADSVEIQGVVVGLLRRY